MSADQKPYGVIGAGSFGSAVSNLLAENGEVLLYVRRDEIGEQIQRDRTASGQPLSDRIQITTDLQYLADNCWTIFPVIPSASFREMIRDLSVHLHPNHILIHGTKGVVVETENGGELNAKSRISRKQVKTMTELILEETVVVRVGCLAGPNLAREIAQKQPAATVVGSHFDEVIREGKSALRSKRFQVYGSYDLTGIELAGVFKNVLAIGSGIVRGLGMGENARALLITRALAGIIHLGKRLEIEPKAFLGLAGIGDIIATCSSPLSRNYQVGFRLAKGEKLHDILGSMEEVAEGVNTLKVVLAMSNYYGLSAPITSVFYGIMFEDLSIQEGLERLMTYRLSKDVDFM